MGKVFFFSFSVIDLLAGLWCPFHPLKLFYRFSPPDFSEPDFYPTELNG